MVRPVNFNITAEKLRQLMYYNPCTGEWTRKTGPFKGKKAGWVSKDGYKYLMVEKVNYQANRLAYLYVNGIWPEELVDHQDGRKSNDCFFNLRAATYSQNTANSNIKDARRVCKYRGVSVVPSRTDFRKFDARIKKAGKTYYLGAAFETEEEAAIAYNKKASELFGPYAILNKIEAVT